MTTTPHRVGPYRIERHLGGGGMGDVFLAQDERLGREVALKRIRTDRTTKKSRQRFLREARTLAALSHPSVVQIFDLIEDDDTWIVMEFVRGTSLRELLEQDESVPWKRAIEIAVDITDALSAAHSVHVVHRDLKTANVVVADDGKVKLLDFGIAVRPENKQDPSLSVDGQLIGTPKAMSPEQARGEALDHRSDLFSLGILLYETLSGVAPFQGDSVHELLAMVIAQEPRPLDAIVGDLPRELVRLVEKLLEKQPDQRPQSAEMVAESLRAVQARYTRSPGGNLLTTLDAKVPAGLPHVPGAPTPGEQDPTQQMAPPPIAAQESTGTGIEERRSVTVLSCELVPVRSGGTLDPEDLLEMTPKFRQHVKERIERYDGSFQSFEAHRATAVMGYPTAHEDDAKRAVLAGLQIVERWSKHANGRVAIRVGVNTGPAVTAQGETTRTELILGATVDTAAQVCRGAEPSEVWVSSTTGALLSNAFEVGTENGDGSRSVQRFTNQDTGSIRLRQRGAMISRVSELSLLADRWNLVREGEGQIVLLRGEAGIGKSRLLAALGQNVATEDHRWIEMEASAYHGSTPFFPVVQWLRRILQESGDPLTEERLLTLAEPLGADAESIVPYLGAALSMDLENYPLPPEEPAEVQRQATLDGFSNLLLALTQERPTILAVEDLHWLDPSTLELLQALCERAESVPLLLVLTSRPEFDAEWLHQSQLIQLSLTRLSAADALRFVESFPGTGQLRDELKLNIVETTDGVPLFLEEMTRSVLEHRSAVDTTSTSGSFEIPATLLGALTARLDRLGDAKETAQVASAQGRTFSMNLLSICSDVDEQELDSRIDDLKRADIVRRRGATGGEFQFKHALVRDAAYTSMLRGQRQRVHGALAIALEEYLPDVRNQQPELLALHLQEAQEFEAAAECWKLAGQRSMAKSAMVEGRQQLDAALKALEELPDTRENKLRRGALLQARGFALALSVSLVAPEARDHYLEVLELGRETNDTPSTFAALVALWSRYLFKGDRKQLLHYTTELESVADDLDNPEIEWLKNSFRASIEGSFGDLRRALELMRPGVERFLELEARPLDTSALGLWEDGVLSFSAGAVFSSDRMLWRLGLSDQALEHRKQVLRTYEGRPRYNALVSYANLYLRLGRFEDALKEAKEAIAEGELIGDPRLASHPQILSGAARVRLGKASGLEDIDRGLTFYRPFGHNWHLADLLRINIEALIELGEVTTGLERVEEALDVTANGADTNLTPDVLCLKGRLLHLADRTTEALEVLHDAADLAQGQGALAVELEIATARARILQQQGRADDAVSALTPILEAVTEGLETLPVEEARELLSRAQAEAGG